VTRSWTAGQPRARQFDRRNLDIRRTIVGCTLLVLCVAATWSTAQPEAGGPKPRGWYSVGPTEPGIWANIASDPNGTVYIGSMGGWVRKSTDSGATWTTVSNGLPPGVNSLAMDAANSDIIYAGALSVHPRTSDRRLQERRWRHNVGDQRSRLRRPAVA
jgi:hypothetical protein